MTAVPDPEDAPQAGPGVDPDAWADAERRVEEYLLGGPRHLTRVDVRERAEIPMEKSTRLWNALGFAAMPDDVPSFTDTDIDVLDLTGNLLADDTFDEAEALAIARTLGQSVARLAEWQANLLRRSIGDASDPDAVVDSVRNLVPLLERLQVYAWRRHLAVTASRMLAGLAHPDGGDAQDTMVVGFADVVGFTALSREVDTGELRSLLERFEAVTGDVVARHGGRIVKTLGDEILFVSGRLDAGVEIAFDLQDEVPDDAGRLALRIGMAYGEVLPRYGDVYGPVVNIASRLTSHARPGAILVDDDLTEAVRSAELPFDLRAVPALAVRGYRHLKPHVLRRLRS